MNELEGLLSEPPLNDDRIARIRRRGKYVLTHASDASARPAEVLVVTVFSVATILWAVASVLVPAA